MAETSRRHTSTRKRVSKAILQRVMSGDRDAIQDCGGIGSTAVHYILKAFREPWPEDSHPRDVHENLISALSLAMEEDAEPMLKVLNGEVSGDEGLAVWTIGKSRDPRVPDALIVALNHKSSFVREQAAQAFIRRRESKVLDALLQRICERSTSVGSAIVFGILGATEFQDVRAIPYLERFVTRKSVKQLPGVLDRTKRLLAKLQSKQADEPATSIDLSQERVTVKRLKSLIATKTVMSLNLDGAKGVSGAAVAAISEARQLEELNLTSSSPRTLDLTPVVKLKSLKSLELWNNQINDKHAKTLGKLSSLENLGLRGTGFTDKHAIHLSKLINLRRLDLDRQITDIGLRSISGLVRMEELALDNSQISAQGVVHLG